MAYQVLARKWRPNRFSELVGQEHVVTAISNALDNDRLHHAYLFTGTRGVGKTTIARIFSKSLNCETGLSANPCGKCHTCLEIENGSFVDLLEIDAASRTKVEDTRELLDNVQYKPTRGKFKVYLIDEVHMLSKHSFNALLKTLEEPPPHVKFLLATTDPQKLPVTILSRCLQFNLKALSREQISEQLSFILSEEDIFSEPQALSQLARAAQGSMRDALSLTDQAIAQGDGKVTNAIVTDMLGLMDKGQIIKLVHGIFSNQSAQVMAQVEFMSQQSVNYEQVLSEIMSLLHQVALTQFVPEACKLETVSARAIFQLAKMMPAEQVQLAYQIALQGKKDISHAADARVGLEMTLLRILAFNPSPISLSIEETNTLTQTNIATPVLPEQSETEEKKTVEDAPLTENTIEQALNEQQNGILQQAEMLGAKQVANENDSNFQNSESAKEQNSPAGQHSYVNSDTYHNDIYPQEDHGQIDSYDNDSYSNNAYSNEHQQSHFEEQSNLTDFHGDNTSDVVENNPSEGNYQENRAPESTTSSINNPVQPNALSATENLIALKNKLSKLELPPTEEQQPAKKSVNDFLPSRFKTDTARQNNEAVIADQNESEQSDLSKQNQITPHVSNENSHRNVSLPENVNSLPVERNSANENVSNGTQSVPENSHTVDQDANLDKSISSIPDVNNKQFESTDSNQTPPPWEQVSTDSTQYSEEKNPVELTPQVTTSPQIINNPQVTGSRQIAESQEEFDPMAHLNEPVEVDVDFDVPAFLENGEKVIHSRQLDTWSQLIEQMQVTALTKQLALHSSYDKNDNVVTLKLLDSKPHLDTETARSQLQEALSELFQQPIELVIEHTQPISTPFAVQQTINLVRMQHATNVAKTDPNINRLKDTFSAQVIDSSIKPR